MNNLKFQTEINAPRDRVWNALWDGDNYREWTKAFGMESHVKGEFKQGTELEFLDDKDDGMYARVDTLKPNEEMAICNLGEVKHGKRQPSTETGIERYTLQEKDGKTVLQVQVDAPEQYVQYLQDSFPQALEGVKKIAEKSPH